MEVAFETAAVKPLEERRTLGEGEVFALDYPDEIITDLLDPQGLLADVRISAHGLTARATGSEGSGVFFLQMQPIVSIIILEQGSEQHQCVLLQEKQEVLY